jgi:hypothetical protein
MFAFVFSMLTAHPRSDKMQDYHVTNYFRHSGSTELAESVLYPGAEQECIKKLSIVSVSSHCFRSGVPV